MVAGSPPKRRCQKSWLSSTGICTFSPRVFVTAATGAQSSSV